MAEFLNTTGVSYHLERVIRNANERLVIISPFLKINPRIKELLEEKDRAKIDIRVVYGKNELRPEENNWLESVASIRTSYRQHLHAKCYMNEEQAILTSMNLLEFSQHNNDEMGILVSRQDDPGLFEEIRKEAQRILQASEEVRVKVSRVEPAETVAPPPPVATRDTPRAPQRKPEPSVGIPKVGFCIRDKAAIPANPGKPYCERCYRSWNRYKDPEYEEKYCHICGEGNDSTMVKPLCLPCYRKHKDDFEFAI